VRISVHHCLWYGLREGMVILQRFLFTERPERTDRVDCTRSSSMAHRVLRGNKETVNR
jgi:hypothetical protein